jgi:phosphoserine phosphatase
MSAKETYGWPAIPEHLRGLPIIFVDVDGTVRGDVLPMVKLARPLVPNFLGKVMFHEPLNSHKLLHFLWNMAKLWTLRTVHREQRRRYKRLFSELHHLAAALLHDTRVEDVRSKFHERLLYLQGLWFDGAVELLRRLTRTSLVIFVTGSEQLQTEQCVALLADQGVDVTRILVHGSLYGYDSSQGRFTGQVQQLNVTLDGKRDAVKSYAADDQCRIFGAIGNSRPDRALFEVVEPAGLRLLVCPTSVVAKRKETTFVIRKLLRSGYQVCWTLDEYVTAIAHYLDNGEGLGRPVLATDSSFANVLTGQALGERYPCLSTRIP